MSPEECAAWYWTVEPQSEQEFLSWLLLRWRVDPVMACIEAFRMIPLPYQAAILLDLFDAPEDVYQFYGLDSSKPKDQVLVPSGHGLGKTRTEAAAIWIHKLTRAFSKQICTAAGGDQLSVNLWGELRKLYRRLYQSQPALAQDWDVLGTSITHKNSEYGDWITIARTARPDKPESLQGAHALDADDPFGQLAALFQEDIEDAPSGGILIIIDEGSGVDDSIREVMEGSLSEPGACLLASGNPTRPDGWFAEDVDNTARYAVHQLDCRQSDMDQDYFIPYRDFGGNVHQLKMHGFVDSKYWQNILEECDGDEDADRFRVRVRGVKPRSAMEQVIRMQWLDDCEKRQPDEASKADPVILSLDFGLTSDKHGFAAVQGYNIREAYEYLPKDKPQEITLDAAQRAIDAQEVYNAKYIIGDANGVGRGAMEYLSKYYREVKPQANVTVIFFNAGAGAMDNKRYRRRRDEMWFKEGRKFFANPRTYMPAIPGLKKQLATPSYHENAAKIIEVETKEQIKKRTGETSGNMADAVLQTRMVYVSAVQEVPKEEHKHPAPFEKHFKRLRLRQESGQYIR